MNTLVTSKCRSCQGVLVLVRGRRAVGGRRRGGHRQHRLCARPQHQEHEEQLQPGEGGKEGGGERTQVASQNENSSIMFRDARDVWGHPPETIAHLHL